MFLALSSFQPKLMGTVNTIFNWWKLILLQIPEYKSELSKSQGPLILAQICQQGASIVLVKVCIVLYST